MLSRLFIQKPIVPVLRNFSTAVKETVGAVGEEIASVQGKEPVLDALGRSYAVGRRKTSSAQVWIWPGSGQFEVNKKCLTEYFQPLQREQCILPFSQTETAGLFDVMCRVKGGGISGQAGAIRLGISRALVNINRDLKPILREIGLMTRDSRRVERKKPGQKKARKKYQWVKR